MRVILIFILALVSACSQQDMFDTMATPAEQQMAIDVANDLRNRDVDAVTAAAAPEIRHRIATEMPPVSDLLADVEGDFSIEDVSTITATNAPTKKTFTLQAGRGEDWAIVEVPLIVTDSGPRVIGFFVTTYSHDPKAQGSFDASAQGGSGYFWLFLMALMPVISVFAIVLIWRTQVVQRRILWTIGCMIALVRFTMDWSSGSVSVQPIGFQILGIGAFKEGPYQAWLLAFAIPIFALLVIFRWLQKRKKPIATTEN